MVFEGSQVINKSLSQLGCAPVRAGSGLHHSPESLISAAPSENWLLYFSGSWFRHYSCSSYSLCLTAQLLCHLFLLTSIFSLDSILISQLSLVSEHLFQLSSCCCRPILVCYVNWFSCILIGSLAQLLADTLKFSLVIICKVTPQPSTAHSQLELNRLLTWALPDLKR